VRAALVLGADADMPLLPRAGAAVGAAPHGLRALLVGVYKLVCTLLVSALSLSLRLSLVLHYIDYSYSSWGVSTERRGTSPQGQAARDLG